MPRKKAEEVTADEEVATKQKEEQEVVEPTIDEEVVTPPLKLYMGKEILSVHPREVNEKIYHSVRLVDGSSYDLTDEEYQEVEKQNE